MKNFLTFAFITGLLLPFQTFALEGPSANVSAPALISLTNKERNGDHLALLSESELLAKAAQLKANDMANRGYFSHVTPEGKMPWSFMDQVGYHYSQAGENLAVNFFDSEKVAEAWMNSPTHRANILKSGFTEIGIGVSNGVFKGKSTIFVAEFFGTPAAPIKSVPKSKIKRAKNSLIARKNTVAY